MSHKYKIRYKLEPEVGEFSADECGQAGGGTDAYIFFSLIYPEDGSFSMNFFPKDGRNDGKELDDNEIFKVWSLLASRLARSETLDEGKKTFAEAVFDTFRKSVLKGRHPENCDCGCAMGSDPAK